MHPFKKRILEFEDTFKKQLSQITTLDALEQLRVHYLARKGVLALYMDELKQLSLEEKREIGPLLNICKQKCETLFEEKKIQLKAHTITTAQQKKELFDVTAYKPFMHRGGLHPLTFLQDQINAIFLSMGFAIVDGPEVETEYYNFDALNIPTDHPAREFWDTLWLDVHGLLLRTHTSSVQIHAMQQKKGPLAIVAPGRCYRHEATDATHDFMFMQVEGLLIDKNVSLGQLLATIKEFIQALFDNKPLKIRVRPSYFPFVEPGIEIDIECPFCNHGCSICKDSEWIESCGAGLVHPHVLEAAGIDPKEFSGFAFGFGLTRLAMLKYGIPDIRLLHTNSSTFLKQF